MFLWQRRLAPFGMAAAVLCGVFPLAFSLIAPVTALAQGRGAAPPAAPPPTPKAIAPIDLTGYWVALVTEDWRYRMVTPAKGDYAAVPLNPEGRRVADTWDPAKDEAAGNQCKSYGAAGLFRVPTRLHITWADDNTLKIETDAGTQTRMLHFTSAGGAGGDWQGVSDAHWDLLRQGRGFLGKVIGGSLTVTTTKMKPGYLRKNGVPYSANAVLTEFFDRTDETDGSSLLIVTTQVEDPLYLVQPFITSTHFKKQADASGWNPTPCAAK
jgi:hypothetical protein